MPVQRYEIFCNSQLCLLIGFFGGRCLCRCKDTKFFAIHNREKTQERRTRVVYAGAKIRNFLQFTTLLGTNVLQFSLFMPVQRYEIFCNSQRNDSLQTRRLRCLCRCKDTKFFAIHNRLRLFNIIARLFMPVQRYEIFCNSQRRSPSCIPDASCLCRCKDTKFFAIHNRTTACFPCETVVYAGAKIRNFLQFTTHGGCWNLASVLFMPVQRYEIFCNSQPIRFEAKDILGCLCRCKDTKFFAIHNREEFPVGDVVVVYAGAKIRNFLQFTTAKRLGSDLAALFMPVQRYEIFCNSQLKCPCKIRFPSCLCRCKDTKFFAIHNFHRQAQHGQRVVYAGAKIRNFLQFTTCCPICIHVILLFMPVQRYEIFCNSQQLTDDIIKIRGCLCRCKDTKFFAIHNTGHIIIYKPRVVYAGAKIRNFLQFTTIKIFLTAKLQLFMPVQRYEIFCNSQQTVSSEK